MPPVFSVQMSSVNDLITVVATMTKETGRRWLFRGHTDASWALLPAVYRGDYEGEAEQFLSQEFRARAGVRHSHRPQYADYADWLALMQHYGLPTRLLDWTHSPLTAAFFATERTMQHFAPSISGSCDAAIWALCPFELNRAQGLKPYIYPLNSGDLEPLVTAAFYEGGDTIPIAAAMAVETDVRMQVQRGAFTIHGTRVPLDEISNCESWLRKFVIPARNVPALGLEVDTLGVGLADLFPDLGSLAKDLASRIRRRR
jgi:hypothetical protein